MTTLILPILNRGEIYTHTNQPFPPVKPDKLILKQTKLN